MAALKDELGVALGRRLAAELASAWPAFPRRIRRSRDGALGPAKSSWGPHANWRRRTMETRPFGRLGRVSALTLGGGGIGNVWGEVDRAEAVATVRAAIDAGITMLDVAPTYGPGEAELVVSEALGGKAPDGVLITTKVGLPDDEVSRDAMAPRIAESLRASLQRLRVDHVDLFLLHTQVRPAQGPTAPQTIGIELVREIVRPEFERLLESGVIRAWGLTAVGHPDALVELFEDSPKPDAGQCVANALDLHGETVPWGAEVADNARVRERAAAAGVAVMGIRVVAAGSLTDALDRPVDEDHPIARDFAAAEGFRRLAAERGEPAAVLAHRYALSMPGLATVVLGVKDRRELGECLAAEAADRLTADEMKAVEATAPGG
jgi:aryl-alcohol dehydrogenase-like predicted oxidoreductase